MNEHVPFAAPDAYAVDVAAWTKRQVELMRLRRFEALDLDNIIGEIESLENEQEHAVESHLIRIAGHLLKLHVSEDAEPRNGWRQTVREQRRQLARRLRKNPSLRRLIPDLLSENWADILQGVVDGLRRDTEFSLAAAIRYDAAQIQDPDFFPGD